MNLVSLADFRAGLRAGRPPAGAVQRLAMVERFSVADSLRRVTFCLSDGSVDRMGDRIAVNGWVLDAYRKNNVVLWAHDASSPPIGRCTNIRVVGNRLLGDVEFASADLYPFAATIYELVRGGFIHAGSVGFVPLDCEWANDDDRPWGIDFKRQELLEFSIVPIPANANALVEARAKGFDTSPLVDFADRQATIARLRLSAPRRRAVHAFTPADFAIDWTRAGPVIDQRRDHESSERRRRVESLAPRA